MASAEEGPSGPEHRIYRVVFDCNLFLQAIGKGGNHAYGCLQLVMNGSAILYMSEDCLGEIDDVLRRPIVRDAFPMLSDEKVDELVGWLRRLAVFLDPVPHVYDYPVDPKDEPYINLAIAVGAVFLVSWDRHITNLGDVQHAEGRRFCTAHPDVSVMNPRDFLARHYNIRK